MLSFSKLFLLRAFPLITSLLYPVINLQRKIPLIDNNFPKDFEKMVNAKFSTQGYTEEPLKLIIDTFKFGVILQRLW